jgi:hypothetical protein
LQPGGPTLTECEEMQILRHHDFNRTRDQIEKEDSVNSIYEGEYKSATRTPNQLNITRIMMLWSKQVKKVQAFV